MNDETDDANAQRHLGIIDDDVKLGSLVASITRKAGSGTGLDPPVNSTVPPIKNQTDVGSAG